MNRLPDDIEQYLLDGQHDRAIDALAKRRNIAPDEAREAVRIRLSEMTARSSEPPGTSTDVHGAPGEAQGDAPRP